jgi:hypothetical protein
MKVFQSLLAVTAIVVGAAVAQADVAGPHTCALTFKATGGGVQAIFGRFYLQGTGNLRCVDYKGNTSVTPVAVTLGSDKLGVAARVAVGAFDVIGSASGVGYVSSPAAYLADYATVGAHAAFGPGGGAQAVLRTAQNNATLSLNLQLARGAGFNVGFSVMRVAALPATAPATK